LDFIFGGRGQDTSERIYIRQGRDSDSFPHNLAFGIALSSIASIGSTGNRLTSGGITP
jgi:hypothetical protein